MAGSLLEGQAPHQTLCSNSTAFWGTSGGAADVAEDDQKIQLFIHAFNQIKEAVIRQAARFWQWLGTGWMWRQATGVNDPNEIIQKSWGSENRVLRIHEPFMPVGIPVLLDSTIRCSMT